ncbi:MAG: PKD domain-containing protein [Tannerella sp.]|jgi:hypothetical protein|nr:PKD domain-containing protein [Tannerella sp.]
MQKSKKSMLVLTGLLSVLSLPAQGKSPYIHKVYDFQPAPGQFINVSPEYEPGDTQADIIRKTEELLVGEESSMISLGAYGGYVIFGFDHPVVNVPGKPDFKVFGNVFINPLPGALSESSEPGIVTVSHDANGNGIPDDEWYELAGSEYHQPATVHNYRITYYKPDADKVPAPDADYPQLTDTTYIRWVDNRGNQGYVSKNTFHHQPYYPQWIEADSLVFEGARLADNYVVDGTGNYQLHAFDWGYADNASNTGALSAFNIEWAVDREGEKKRLSEIHFVKVYTAVNQYCGWLGESSTEISGAMDLHPEATATAANRPQATESFRLLNHPVQDQLLIASPVRQTVTVFGYDGRKRMSFLVECGMNTIPCSQLPKGFYILAAQDQTVKFSKQ